MSATRLFVSVAAVAMLSLFSIAVLAFCVVGPDADLVNYESGDANDSARLWQNSTIIDDGCHAACSGVDPKDENLLHVFYSSDLSQLEGMKASIGSVLKSSWQPRRLSFHVLTFPSHAEFFRSAMGVPQACQGAVSTKEGALLSIHVLDKVLVNRSVVQVRDTAKKGKLSAPENFARFYMAHVVPRGMAVYVDSDVIVRADLAPMVKELGKSGKTVGFVRRSELMKSFITPKPATCKKFSSNFSAMVNLTAYNVGLFALSLERWRETGVTARVEAWVAKANTCHGTLWAGGSQAPLLLAFHDLAREAPPDFHEFPSIWCANGLGYTKNPGWWFHWGVRSLHWQGVRKPWLKDGLHRGLWQPGRARFDRSFACSGKAFAALPSGVRVQGASLFAHLVSLALPLVVFALG